MPERARLYVMGQAAYPEPALGKRCDQCSHFRLQADQPGTVQGFGFCMQLKAVTGRAGASFRGADAIACLRFSEGGAA